MKTRSLLAVSATLCLLPALLFGCGGGSSGPSTPRATATPVPTPTPTPQPFVSVPLELPDGRVARADISASDLTAKAIITVPKSGTTPATVRVAIPFNIDAGTYVFTGTFTPPNGVELKGKLKINGIPVNVTIKGTIPTQTTAGHLTITGDGISVSFTIPALGTTTNSKSASK